MKPLVLFALLVLSALSLKAGIIVDVVVAPEEEVAKKTIPVTCDVVRDDAGGASVKLTLKEPFGVVGTFDSYELRVLKKPVRASELKKEFFHLDLISRRELRREKTASFKITKGELRSSYIVISSWTGRKGGMASMRSLCLPVAALVER